MQEAEKMLNGKTILITGGTGSFGNAFTEYVLTHYDPKRLSFIPGMNLNNSIWQINLKIWEKTSFLYWGC